MNIYTLLDDMNGTGLAELYQALNYARQNAGTANFHALSRMIEATEEAGIANCGETEFTIYLKGARDNQ